MVDPDLRRLVLGCFLPGFTGPNPPPWLLAGLRDGLAGVVLFGSNLGDGRRVGELTGRLREHAGRPLVFALDEEGGDVTRLDTVRGSAVPGQAALGWLDDPATTSGVYAELGDRLMAAGVNLNLAPVADVNSDPHNPVIGVRSFSADPQVAARHVAAAVRGLQSSGVAACVKHFPGHGATSQDSHHEVARIDRSAEQLWATELVPFQAGIAAGTRAVMTGHLMVPALADELVTVSAAVTTGLLRNRLGFDGVVVTDALEMKAVSGTIGMAEGFIRALAAGADAIETGAQDYPELVAELPAAVAAAVADGRLDHSRLADAAARTASLAAGAPSIRPRAVDLSGLAARCLEVIGPLPELERPLVIECRSPNGMATGALPWSLAEPLGQRCPGTEALVLDGPVPPAKLDAATTGRSLVCVLRDPARNPWQQAVLAAAERHPGPTVLVDVGWPSRLDTDLPLLRTRGIAPGLLAAAAERLAAG